MSVKRILFVCLGNICRSPSAEAVFQAYVTKQGRADEFVIDSAGTSGYHQGEPADKRMQAHASRRGYRLTSLSRPLTYQDFFDFDLIVGMDESNRRNILSACPTDELTHKVSILTDWHPEPACDHIPDPYYGGAEGFERVLDLIESCCPYLLERIDNNNLPSNGL